jgi:hypothetical protein
MVLITKNQFSFYFFFYFAIFLKTGVIRKLTGLANQHKKLVIRDNWGIASCLQKTDADAVFGILCPV